MSLLNEFKNGIFYSAIGKYSNVVIQLLIQAILSRILTPAEYGIVAVVNIFLVFFQMLADFGIGPAIIQNKDLDDEEINSIFGFSLYLSIALAVIFILLGYPISLFYDNSVYIPISMVMSVTVFFYGLLIVPQNMILRKKDFRTVNMVTILANIINGVVSITLAFAGFSYYSLILGNTAKAATLFTVFFFKSKVKPSFKIDTGPLKKIYSFSKNQFLFNFINYFSRNLDSLLIGRFFSASALAFYDKAYQVSLYPNQVLTNVITPVIQPIMSEYETNLDRIKRVYLQISNVLATIGMPLSVFLFFSAEEVILFLFGQQWGNSVPTFQILALSVWIQMILSSTGGIFQSGNRTDLLLLSGVLSTILNVLGIITGIIIGRIEYVAIMLVLSFSLNFLQANYLLMYRMFSSNFWEFIQSLLKPALLAFMQVIFFLVLPDLGISVLVDLFIKGLGFLLVFLIGIIITGDFFKLKNLLLNK